jgi:hypothetical protein
MLVNIYAVGKLTLIVLISFINVIKIVSFYTFVNS